MVLSQNRQVEQGRVRIGGSAGSLWVPAPFCVLSSSVVFNLLFSCILFPAQGGLYFIRTPAGGEGKA